MSVEQEREILIEAHRKGRLATWGAYVRLSGPGWLQSAITLGGGSLASSLYLGVLAGFTMMWLQPIAMLFGIVMLSAIGYVALSTGERPLKAINRHVNPVLGWSWAVASLVASMVWCMPQYSLANGVVQQNLLPNLLGKGSALDDWTAKVIITIFVLVVTVAITWCYDRKGLGIRLYEGMLKTMVALIVLCFIGVVIWMWLAEGDLNWGAVFSGFIPNLNLLSEPAPGFSRLLADLPSESVAFWESYIVSEQRSVMISAAATAVGINMTFLLPYSVLRRGWTKEFRGLLAFDMATGMFIPFVLATSCVIIASAKQFHPTEKTAQMTEADFKALPEAKQKKINDFAPKADKKVLSIEEKRLAYSLLRRDANDLAQSLSPLTGGGGANLIFGLGVLGMTLSTITILMLISGLVICEMLGYEPTGWPYRLGCLAAVTGVLGPFLWAGEARFYLAVPASVFGMTLLPIAYLSFFLLINQRKFLKGETPEGFRHFLVNTIMYIATLVAGFASAWVIWEQTGWIGVIGIVVFIWVALMVQFLRKPPQT